jgi:NADH-quinone oxidoreductase subunit M
MAQKDLKLIIGYSSSSHMGYVLLGIASLTPLGMNGAVLLMFAHGIMTALSFAVVGHIYDQTHTRWLPDLGGLGKKVPFIATIGVMASMASAGLPGFANFVAELLVILGTWDRYKLHAVVAILGVVITSVYMLRMVRGMFFGPISQASSHTHDAHGLGARVPYLILTGTLLFVGCWPDPLLRLIDTSARPLVERVTHIPTEMQMAIHE